MVGKIAGGRRGAVGISAATMKRLCALFHGVHGVGSWPPRWLPSRRARPPDGQTVGEAALGNEPATNAAADMVGSTPKAQP